MPIFSNRGIVRMLTHIRPLIGSARAHDLERRLVKSGEPAIGAEWEIRFARRYFLLGV